MDSLLLNLSGYKIAECLSDGLRGDVTAEIGRGKVLLEQLALSGRIAIRWAPLFDQDPGPMPATFDFELIAEAKDVFWH